MLSNTVSLTWAKRKERVRVRFAWIYRIPAIWVEDLWITVKLLLKVIGVDGYSHNHAFFDGNVTNIVIFNSFSFEYSSGGTCHSQGFLLYLFHVLHLLEFLVSDVLKIISNDLVNLLFYFSQNIRMFSQEVKQNSCIVCGSICTCREKSFKLIYQVFSCIIIFAFLFLFSEILLLLLKLVWLYQ